MTERTSLSHGHTLNSIAFQANTGMPEAEFITSSAQKLHRTVRENDLQILQIGARIKKPHHFGSIPAASTQCFPHRAQPDPAASS